MFYLVRDQILKLLHLYLHYDIINTCICLASLVISANIDFPSVSHVVVEMLFVVNTLGGQFAFL